MSSKENKSDHKKKKKEKKLLTKFKIEGRQQLKAIAEIF